MHFQNDLLSPALRRSLRLLGCLMLISGLALTPACGNSSSAQPAADASQTTATGPRVALLEISGMTCHGCASGVQESLSKLPGVVEAVVNQEEKTARVTLSEDSATGEAELRAAVDTKGYKVTDCTWDS